MSQPKFWAKTGQGELRQDGQPKYHPVICHLADTAAVAMEIVRTYLSPLARQRLANGFGLPDDESLVRFCGFMAGSHDLGKVSPAFQFQVSEVGKLLAGETLYDCWSSLPGERQKPKNAPHGTVTAATLPNFLVDIGVGRDLSERHAKRLARKLGTIVGGHHGFFPAQKEIDDLDSAIAGTDEVVPTPVGVNRQVQPEHLDGKHVVPTPVGVNRVPIAVGLTIVLRCPHARGGEPKESSSSEQQSISCPHARGGEP